MTALLYDDDKVLGTKYNDDKIPGTKKQNTLHKPPPTPVYGSSLSQQSSVETSGTKFTVSSLPIAVNFDNVTRNLRKLIDKSLAVDFV